MHPCDEPYSQLDGFHDALRAESASAGEDAAGTKSKWKWKWGGKTKAVCALIFGGCGFALIRIGLAGPVSCVNHNSKEMNYTSHCMTIEGGVADVQLPEQFCWLACYKLEAWKVTTAIGLIQLGIAIVVGQQRSLLIEARCDIYKLFGWVAHQAWRDESQQFNFAGALERGLSKAARLLIGFGFLGAMHQSMAVTSWHGVSFQCGTQEPMYKLPILNWIRFGCLCLGLCSMVVSLLFQLTIKEWTFIVEEEFRASDFECRKGLWFPVGNHRLRDAFGMHLLNYKGSELSWRDSMWHKCNNVKCLKREQTRKISDPLRFEEDRTLTPEAQRRRIASFCFICASAFLYMGKANCWKCIHSIRPPPTVTTQALRYLVHLMGYCFNPNKVGLICGVAALTAAAAALVQLVLMNCPAHEEDEDDEDDTFRSLVFRWHMLERNVREALKQASGQRVRNDWETFECHVWQLDGNFLDFAQATHSFTPGELGITCDDNGYVLSDGPSDTKGIKKGDQIVKVGTEKFSKDALGRAEKSGIDYEVTVSPNLHACGRSNKPQKVRLLPWNNDLYQKGKEIQSGGTNADVCISFAVETGQFMPWTVSKECQQIVPKEFFQGVVDVRIVLGSKNSWLQASLCLQTLTVVLASIDLIKFQMDFNFFNDTCRTQNDAACFVDADTLRASETLHFRTTTGWYWAAIGIITMLIGSAYSISAGRDAQIFSFKWIWEARR